MLFNSPEFAVFFPLVFVLYWCCFARHTGARNLFLLVVSYIFYGWWDPRFLLLIIASSIVDFVVSSKLGDTDNPRTRWWLLAISLLANLGVLGYFKYFNFFVDSFVIAMSQLGYTPSIHTLKILLPVGISFYTFQTLGYTIDVYRRNLSPTRDVLAFFAYVAFFPQLVAGPIERASNLLTRFEHPVHFDYDVARDAMRQILWGFFKKIVVADTCGRLVGPIFDNYSAYSGSTLVLGAVYFAFQIYGDFSGYSDIAIGTARLMGFDLMRNFAYPYFARDITEFWRRWHISLSTWFRDYVYIPLGGSRFDRLTSIRNTFIVFLTSGLWHGANWTFVLWGLLHWLYFLPVFLVQQKRRADEPIAAGRWLPTLREAAQIVITFSLVTLAWVFFRAPSVGVALGYTKTIFSASLFTVPAVARGGVFWIAILVAVEWLQRHREHGLDIRQLPVAVRWLIYLIVVLLCLYKYQPSSEFIYFQF